MGDSQLPQFSREQLGGSACQRLPVRTFCGGWIPKINQRNRFRNRIDFALFEHSQGAAFSLIRGGRTFHSGIKIADCAPGGQTT